MDGTEYDSDSVPTLMTDRMSTRVRLRLREALDTRGISQRALAARLSRLTGDEWTQSRIGKILTGRVELKVDDVHAITEAAGISLVEVMREHGRELVADLTPTEMRILSVMRSHPGVMLPLADMAKHLTVEDPRQVGPRRGRRTLPPTPDR